MPPRTRKTSPAAEATSPTKKAPAKKAQAKKAPAAPPEPEVPQGAEPDVGDVGTSAPVAPSVARSAGRVTRRSSSEDSHTTTTGWPGAVEVVTSTDQRTSTTTEFEPGHTVTETVTTSTVRAERIPVPYAGPASDHPVPVG